MITEMYSRAQNRSQVPGVRRQWGRWTVEAAGKPLQAVIPSAARNLALTVFKAKRDSSSPMAPRNDRPEGFFRSLCRQMGTEQVGAVP